jgi:hypothetical protein
MLKDDLIDRIKKTRAKNLGIKSLKNKVVVSAPSHSSRSAFLDDVFRWAKNNGIRYRGRGHDADEVYTVEFTLPKTASMNKKKIAKRLLRLAKVLLAEDGGVEEIEEIEPQGSKPVKERRHEARFLR